MELGPQIGRLKLLEYWSFSSVSWSHSNYCLAGPKSELYRIVHCVSKNVPPLTCCNLYTHGSIARIFGKKCCRESRQSKRTLFSHLT